jgi:4-hydroxy-4-methyl-2-oxoglutarate aldolase
MMYPSIVFKHTQRKVILSNAIHNFRCLSSAIDAPRADAFTNLLRELRKLDTSCLCDADKSILADKRGHVGLKLMDGKIRPLNHSDNSVIMAGLARTVQLTEKDDFLAVLRGLNEAQSGEVLIVNTLSSSRAVAGEIFCAEAERKGLSGIVVDGAARDTAYLRKYSVRFYATSIAPYSGTIQSVGKMQEVVTCGGIEVCPGEIVVGDSDGILVGSFDSFSTVLHLAKTIQAVEEKLLKGISSGSSLTSMTNLEEHLNRRLADEKDSSLEFRV